MIKYVPRRGGAGRRRKSLITEEDREAIIKAYIDAYRGNRHLNRKTTQSGDRRLLVAYLEAIKVWCQRHPDHVQEYAARQVVEIILDHKYSENLTGFMEI